MMRNATDHSVTGRVSGGRGKGSRKLAPYGPFLHCVQSDKTESDREDMAMKCALKKFTCVFVAAAGIFLL